MNHLSKGDPLIISCDTCVMRHSNACDDCLVTALCGGPEEPALVFDMEEQRALRLLANAGMVPTIRHRAAG